MVHSTSSLTPSGKKANVDVRAWEFGVHSSQYQLAAAIGLLPADLLCVFVLSVEKTTRRHNDAKAHQYFLQKSARLF